MNFLPLINKKYNYELITHILKLKSNWIKTMIYKKTGEWYIEWKRVTTSGTTSDNKWQRVTTSGTTSGTTSDNEWQRMTTNDNEWQWMVQRMTKSDNEWYNEWQKIAMSDSEWQQWYNEWKRHSTLQRMDDCRRFDDKNRYTTTSRDGWLQLEWLNKQTFIKVFQESN